MSAAANASASGGAEHDFDAAESTGSHARDSDEADGARTADADGVADRDDTDATMGGTSFIGIDFYMYT